MSSKISYVCSQEQTYLFVWTLRNETWSKFKKKQLFFSSFCYFYILIQKYQKFEIEHWLSWNEKNQFKIYELLC